MFYKLKMFWQGFKKEKYLFFDVNDASLALANNIVKRKKNSVWFLLNELSEKQNKSIITPNAVCYKQLFSTKSSCYDKLLKKLILKRRSCLFFLSLHDDTNIQSLSLFFTSWNLGKIDKVKQNIKLIIRVQNELLYPVVEQIIKDAPFEVNYSIFNDAELIASEIVQQHHPIDTLNINTQNARVDDIYETLIVGWDPLGNAILRKTIEATQLVGTQFKATVMQNNAQQNEYEFFNKYPEIKNYYEVNFINLEFGSPASLEWLQQHAVTLKQIFIATGEDEKNLTLSTELCAFFKNRNIPCIPVVALSRAAKNETVFTEKNVVQLDYFQQAKAVHHFYNQLKPFAQRIPWENLSEMKKQVNVAAARSILTKLKLLGKTPDELKQMSELEYQLFLQQDPDKLLNIAKSEHLRWNATYITCGWKTWQLHEIPEGAPHQDETQKLHACLVDWDSLNEIEKRFEIPFQSYDYNNILIIRMLIVNNVIR